MVWNGSPLILYTGVDEVWACSVGAGDLEADGLCVDRSEHVELPGHDYEAVGLRGAGAFGHKTEPSGMFTFMMSE